MTYGDAAVSVLVESDNRGVMWGDSYLLDSIWYLKNSDKKSLHPLIRWKRVLDGLERDIRFYKSYVELNGRRFRNFTMRAWVRPYFTEKRINA